MLVHYKKKLRYSDNKHKSKYCKKKKNKIIGNSGGTLTLKTYTCLENWHLY